MQQAYYRLLSSMGQEDSAEQVWRTRRLCNRLPKIGWPTAWPLCRTCSKRGAPLPRLNMICKRSSGPRRLLGEIWQPRWAPARPPTFRVQPLDQLPTPESIADTVDQAIDRALGQRPDLMQQVAEIRSATARVKEARAAYYPALNLNVSPSVPSLYGMQSPYAWSHTADLAGGITIQSSMDRLRWRRAEKPAWPRLEPTFTRQKQKQTSNAIRSPTKFGRLTRI